jgi:hypothetical protein
VRLLPDLMEMLTHWKSSFADHRTHKRAMGFALAFLVCLGRRTISRAICAQQRQFRAWSPDYKFFSESPWKASSLFDTVLDEAYPLMWEKQPLAVALDDTIARKTGKKIPWAKWSRDPLSPPFNINLVWALRFLHATLLLWPAKAAGAARAIPIAFQLAPPTTKPKAPKKPPKSAGASEEREYKKALKVHDKALKEFRQKQRKEGLSAQGVRLLKDLRARFDKREALLKKVLWAIVDASFCNRTVLQELPERTVLIGRTRKDIRLFAEPAKATKGKGSKKGRGRNRKYGQALPTPEEFRKDPKVPWKRCGIFAAGKKHNLRYKTMDRVLWKSGSGDRAMRLIVVAPLQYRAHGHLLYRKEAYLLVSNPSVKINQALQAYFYRWEIEADQKEEKDLLGVGQAQVWSEHAVPRQPAFHVASYAALLVTAVKAFGLNTTDAARPLPLWRKRKPPTRLSAGQLIDLLRHEIELHESLKTRKSLRRSPGKDKQFRADALKYQSGLKIPVSIKAVLANAW